MKPKQEDGGPAFARPHSPYTGSGAQQGMPLRDYFAAAALQGALASKETLEAAAALVAIAGAGHTLERLMAIRSYAFADAMLAVSCPCCWRSCWGSGAATATTNPHSATALV